MQVLPVARVDKKPLTSVKLQTLAEPILPEIGILGTCLGVGIKDMPFVKITIKISNNWISLVFK